MSCFLMIFHRNLEVMMFSRKMKNYMVFTLILGGLNVAISFVLGMFSEFHMFSQVRFLQISLNISMEKHVHRWSPRAQNSGNTNEKQRIHVFFVFSIVGNLKEK